MKITPKQFAVLLYEVTKDEKGVGLNKAIKAYVQMLFRNRAIAQLPRIERMYRDHYNAQEGVIDVEVTSAHDVAKKIQHALGEVSDKNAKIELTEKVDAGVLGGARIRVGDYMLDDTLKSRLTKLRKNIILRA